jgi:hypothetical protein
MWKTRSVAVTSYIYKQRKLSKLSHHHEGKFIYKQLLDSFENVANFNFLGIKISNQNFSYEYKTIAHTHRMLHKELIELQVHDLDTILIKKVLQTMRQLDTIIKLCKL